MSRRPPSPPFSLQSSSASPTPSAASEGQLARGLSRSVREKVAQYNKVEVPILLDRDIVIILDSLPPEVPEHVQISLAKEAIAQKLKDYHRAADAVLGKMLKTRAQCFPQMAEEFRAIRGAMSSTAHFDHFLTLGTRTFWARLPQHYSGRTVKPRKPRRKQSDQAQLRNDRPHGVTKPDPSVAGNRRSARIRALHKKPAEDR